MGRADKIITKRNLGNDKKYVSEATISKLLNDFNSASLQTSTSLDINQDRASSYTDEKYNTHYEELVSSLKQFHLRRPADRRSRLKAKKDLQRKAKSTLDNKYNLSIAAINSHKCIVWPGKLNCLSKVAYSGVILQPSRLTVPGKWNTHLSTASINSSIHTTSSSEEKSRIADYLNNPTITPFSNTINIKGSDSEVTQLSFAKLCKHDVNTAKESCKSLSKHHLNSHHSTTPDPTLLRTQNYRDVSAKHQQTFSLQENHSQCCKLSSGHHKCYNKPSLCAHFSQGVKDTSSHHSHSATSLGDGLNATSLSDRVTPVNNQSSASHLASSGVSPERSCSEEMRMEEANVNELASYFEDLLYIPRKMSVMAEMMYA